MNVFLVYLHPQKFVVISPFVAAVNRSLVSLVIFYPFPNLGYNTFNTFTNSRKMLRDIWMPLSIHFIQTISQNFSLIQARDLLRPLHTLAYTTRTQLAPISIRVWIKEEKKPSCLWYYQYKEVLQFHSLPYENERLNKRNKS